jgi:trehalose utilization protein
LIWWGHLRHGEVPDALARDIVRRVRDGRLALIPLHSALSAKPFMQAMRLRTIVDAAALTADLNEPATGIELRLVEPGPEAVRPKDAPPTPLIEPLAIEADGRFRVRVKLPACSISAFREDGKPSRTTVLAPHHPIAAGLPATFEIPQTEMYDEPFQVPEPDLVLFEERWQPGERFRSGCLWRLGKGYVFYYRPGHETDPVYTNAEPIQVLENAVRYLGAEKRLLRSDR